MITPDWLAARGGLVKEFGDRSWVVIVDGQPAYRLDALPAKGQFTSAITQTNNGKRLDRGRVDPTIEAAMAGGLEELRAELGW